MQDLVEARESRCGKCEYCSSPYDERRNKWTINGAFEDDIRIFLGTFEGMDAGLQAPEATNNFSCEIWRDRFRRECVLYTEQCDRPDVTVREGFHSFLIPDQLLYATTSPDVTVLFAEANRAVRVLLAERGVDSVSNYGSEGYFDAGMHARALESSKGLKSQTMRFFSGTLQYSKAEGKCTSTTVLFF